MLEFQNDTMTAAAVSSAGRETNQDSSEFQPCAKDRAGSTKTSAWRTMPPLRGTSALSGLCQMDAYSI